MSFNDQQHSMGSRARFPHRTLRWRRLGAQYFVPGTIVTELAERHEINQDSLAATFADRCEPYRGYGPGAVVILHRIRDGVPWRQAAGEVFDGTGSCGTGAAMRVAPLGAWFFDDLDRAADQAARSAEVTHRHPEGSAGAVAVAVALAASLATRTDLTPTTAPPRCSAVPSQKQATNSATARGSPRRTRAVRDLERRLPPRRLPGGHPVLRGDRR
jgi:ADP-ribosylglycohydrolase